MKKPAFLFLVCVTAAISASGFAQTAVDEAPKSAGIGDPLAGNRVRDLVETLSPEGRIILLGEIRAQQKANRPDNQKLRAVRQSILNTLEDEKFDADILRRLLREERTLTALLQERRHESTVAAMQKMSAMDRKNMALNLRQIDVRARERMTRRKENPDYKKSGQ